MHDTTSMIHWLSPQHQERAAYGEPRSSDERADLAVVIVSWNVKKYLIENIEALLKSRGTVAAELILVDNASQDGTAEAVRQKYPEVHVIANDQNLGFAAANERGMKVMKARHVLLLNPDMRVESDALQKTVEYLDTHPDVAVVGGRLTSLQGGLVKSVRRFPDVWSQLAIIFKLPHLFPHVIDRYLYSDFDDEREQAVDSVRGSYFAMNRTALDTLGGLDQRYFIWFDEVDYCKQAIMAHMKVMYVPMIRVTDHVGKSFRQQNLFWKQKQLMRSMIRYFEKWHPWWQATMLKVLRPPLLALAWVVDSLFL